MFPLGNKELKIGILGFTEGNGHPYSWSAMFNHYDKEEMVKMVGEEYNDYSILKYFDLQKFY